MVNNGLQVLYIEDDELVRRAGMQSLQLAGFEVVGHASVESASRALGADFAGAIVSDIRLPGASGLDLLAQCRERAPGVPVILVTGHGDISMAVQAMRDGAYDFIEKPFASERLIETVRRALSNAASSCSKILRCAESWRSRTRWRRASSAVVPPSSRSAG